MIAGLRRAYVGLEIAALGLFVSGAWSVISIPFQWGVSPKGSLPALPQFASLAMRPPEAQLQDLQTHALFYIPDPPPAPSLSAGSADSVLQKYQVIGIVQGRRPAAVLEEADKTTHLVEPGENFNGIKVINVLSKSVLLDFQGRQKLLPLRDAPA